MRLLICFLFALTGVNLHAQNTSSRQMWRAVLQRTDSNDIVFNFELEVQNKKPVLYVINATERIKVDSISVVNDSAFVKMPVFESSFKVALKKNIWEGVWIKGTAGAEQVMPFYADVNSSRFPLTNTTTPINVTGRWAVNFASDKSPTAMSIAELKQAGNQLTGTFLTPTGDYRFQQGVVDGNKLKLSGFDGGHAYLFTADITNDNTITNGKFYSGPRYVEDWSAMKNAKAIVKQDVAAMFVKPGEEKLNFSFRDIDGKQVSINDERFKNKVVIVQLMGSWCPNCMDETAFLSDYYSENKQRGIEIIALAYEYSTVFNRSQQSLRKFQQRFNVQYPILITGVTVGDTLRTEKTLPQVTKIKVFPSSIVLDKKGKIRNLDTGFYGPGTGEHYEAYKKEFYKTIDDLLNER